MITMDMISNDEGYDSFQRSDVAPEIQANLMNEEATSYGTAFQESLHTAKES